MVLFYVLALALGLVLGPGAFAALAASPDPSASPTAVPDALATQPPFVGTGLFDGLNSLLVGIEDFVFSFWPSTPDYFKLSSIVGGLQTQFPAVPWYLMGTLLVALQVVLLVVFVKRWLAWCIQMLMLALHALQIVRLLAWLGVLTV
jgi:hypothetical protein